MAKQPPPNNYVSRRDFLFVAAAGGGAIIGTNFAASPANAAKMSPQAMSYRPSPNGNQSCGNCANFQPPTSCKVIDGKVSPSGWCILYRSK